MGGDVCHHGGEFRPTPYVPLPSTIAPSPLNCPIQPCPGSIFLDIHPTHSATQPFYKLPVENGISYNIDEATGSVEKTTEFDAAPNVFVCIAHDDVCSTQQKYCGLLTSTLYPGFVKYCRILSQEY
jgi:hypothetical protein